MQAQIKRAEGEPGFQLTLNFGLYPVRIEATDIVIAEDANAEGMAFLQQELVKAWEDPNYIAVLPFGVHTLRIEKRETSSWFARHLDGSGPNVTRFPKHSHVAGLRA